MYPFEIYMGEMLHFIIGWNIGFLPIRYQAINLTSAITPRRIALHPMGDVVIIRKV